MPKILVEISVGSQLERFVSAHSDQNIRDHLWRWFTLTDRTGGTILPKELIALHRFCRFHLFRELGKGITTSKRNSSFPPGLIGKCRSIFPSRSLLVSDESVEHNVKHPLFLIYMYCSDLQSYNSTWSLASITAFSLPLLLVKRDNG